MASALIVLRIPVCCSKLNTAEVALRMYAARALGPTSASLVVNWNTDDPTGVF